MAGVVGNNLTSEIKPDRILRKTDQSRGTGKNRSIKCHENKLIKPLMGNRSILYLRDKPAQNTKEIDHQILKETNLINLEEPGK
jgi:hypothetical protein